MRWRKLALGSCVAVTVLAYGAAVSAGASAESPGTQASPTSSAVPSRRALSNEWTLTRWAHPLTGGAILTSPRRGSRRVGRIHLETEDGFAEVYLLLSAYTDPSGMEWVELRIPGRPNGRTGWVSREALGDFHRTQWSIVVNLRRRRLSAFFDGRLRRTAPVGVGKPSTPTPTGRFWIRERFQVKDRSSPYWPYALGTSDYSTLSEWPGGGVVGIHGPFGEPGAIPGDPSHGCIRMLDADIGWLGPRVTLGTPVHVIAG
jgi:hypothetical protein